MTSLKVPRAKSGTGSSGTKVLSSHPSARRRRNELRPTSERCCGGRLFITPEEKVYRRIYIFSVSRGTISPLEGEDRRDGAARCGDGEETRTANPVVAVVSDVVIFPLSRHRAALLFLLFTNPEVSLRGQLPAAVVAPHKSVILMDVYSRNFTLRRAPAPKCR